MDDKLKKKDVVEMNDTELFSAFYHNTVKLVKEANSNRGETKKSMQECDWIVEESIKRFELKREILVEHNVLNE